MIHTNEDAWLTSFITFKITLNPMQASLYSQYNSRVGVGVGVVGVGCGNYSMQSTHRRHVSVVVFSLRQTLNNTVVWSMKSNASSLYISYFVFVIFFPPVAGVSYMLMQDISSLTQYIWCCIHLGLGMWMGTNWVGYELFWVRGVLL